jgi:CRP/FNR family transcriptional regulator, cyclic AMP receptor protein
MVNWVILSSKLNSSPDIAGNTGSAGRPICRGMTNRPWTMRLASAVEPAGCPMPGPTYQEKRQIFYQHPLLGKFSDSEVDTLLKYSRVECYPEGEEIFAKDSPPTFMMLVLRGSVRVGAISLAGREVVLNIIDPGELVGEIGMLDGRPRSGDAVAMTDCELLVLNRRDFMPLLEKHADICLMLIKILCEKLRHTSEQVEDLVFRDVEQRIAKALLQLCDRFGRPDKAGCLRELHLSQSELATIIGITRESVNKQLRAWQRAGFVDLAKESIVIRDCAALEQLVRGSD